MNHPKLKHPKLCRILTYIIVLGCGLLPILAVSVLPVSSDIQVLVVLASLAGLLVFLFKNVLVLMAVDVTLASLSCNRSARTQYTLPSGRSEEAIRRSILCYGKKCSPGAVHPQPAALRYKFSSPLSIYSRGIERVVAAYEIDYLDNDSYWDIFHSAKINSKALKGKKKAIFLDKTQKKQSLHRVTVILILAKRVDPWLSGSLYKLVCKNCGNEEENCVVPCIVDLEHRTCVFNSLRVPYVGFSYAVKNRGIRIIRRCVFGGNPSLRKNQYFLEPIPDIDPEKSLWTFWKEVYDQIIGEEKRVKKLFQDMAELEIRQLDDLLYMKWDERGLYLAVEPDVGNHTVKVQSVLTWDYPKTRLMGKETARAIEEYISAYYFAQGYDVKFVDDTAMRK